MLDNRENLRIDPTPQVRRAIQIKKVSRWINAHWLGIALVLFFVFNLGAWTAPALMKLKMERAANIVYTIYSPLCHQMAQRSFFLFGEKPMYTPEEMGIPSTGNMGAEMLMSRQFRGNSSLGWKVAWSDRMVYMYCANWLALLILVIISRYRTVKPISIWLLMLALLPMAIDGGTHMLSDTAGLFAGFRYNNEWLATLTGHLLPEQFYIGDQLGSFNSLMRLLSGLTFGFGTIWFAVPYLTKFSEQTVTAIDDQLARASMLYNL